MGLPIYAGLENFIRILQGSSLQNIRSIVECMDYRTVKIIAEILLNILKGVIPITEKETTQFRLYKPMINKIISTKSNLAQKKEILAAYPQLVKLTSKVLMNYIG